jgi:hypothetical protein
MTQQQHGIGGIAMTVHQRIVKVTHSQYYLAELGAISTLTPAMYSGFNGLISSNGALGIIMTGTESGPVKVEADWRDDEPAPDLDSWDDVVEISMNFAAHEGSLYGPEDSAEEARTVPALPPGTYRVRVHARGRDQGNAVRNVWDTPVEEHLIITWPSPTHPETLHKLTDQYGAETRNRSAIRTAPPDTTSAQTPGRLSPSAPAPSPRLPGAGAASPP